ncbi:SseB family protein [Trichloromonas sp.]|uniref:SseB family protein n=1 Tax=Trichloromonas sp. TaxID=3069249 RepID=UPI003D818D9C
MSLLDQALKKFIQDENEHAQYYDLVLNTLFYVPTMDEEAKAGKTEVSENDAISPILLESDGKHYMMLFDSKERLTAWARESVSYVVFPGYAIAEMTPPNLHWAVNVGTDFSKEFVPEEIAWLKDVVKECNEETGGQG